MPIESIGLMASAKLAGVALSSYVAWTAWRAMPEPAIRRTMKKLFKDGELCKKLKSRKGKEVLLYPAINRVSIYQDCMQVVFTLPDGMDPGAIRKKEWIFQQVFGEHVELAGTAKTFTMTVYNLDVIQYDYDYVAISAAVAGLKLPIYVGRSRQGNEFYDMTEHPHLLIAGETGSGKSVAVRSILTTLIKTCGGRLQLYCADLKRSEFHLFRDVADRVMIEPHELQKTVLAIRKEMRRRGDQLDAAGLANINDLPEDQRPPYIVLAIDEVALLKKEKDLMEGIEEISTIGRALGVFLILSLQRPDADVLDGKLKNNLTVRLAFRHADEINSRITLGSGEAAEIKQSQKGRAVLKLDGIRFVQGPYLDIPQARALLDPHKRPPADDDLLSMLGPVDGPEDDNIEFGVLPF